MLFTVYFFNWTTGEVVAAHRRAVSARAAVNTFRRKMRDTGTLCRGNQYSLLLYKGQRDLADWPADYADVAREVAR